MEIPLADVAEGVQDVADINDSRKCPKNGEHLQKPVKFPVMQGFVESKGRMCLREGAQAVAASTVETVERACNSQLHTQTNSSCLTI